MSDDITNAIAENITAPKKASGDSGSVEQHSLAEQIAADRYLSAKAAAKAKRLGVQFKKMIPPGSA